MIDAVEKRNAKPVCYNEGGPFGVRGKIGRGLKTKLAGWLAGWRGQLHSYANKALIPGCSCCCPGRGSGHSEQLAFRVPDPQNRCGPARYFGQPYPPPDRELIITANQGLLLIYQLPLNKGASLETAVSSGQSEAGTCPEGHGDLGEVRLKWKWNRKIRSR